MEKNSIDFVLRLSDEQGKIRRNIVINNFFDNFDSLLFQAQTIKNTLSSINFKLMNGISTSLQFHLAGIIEKLSIQHKNNFKNNSNEEINLDIIVYSLYSELLKLIDAIICDLNSGFAFIDLIGLHNTIEYVCNFYYFVSKVSSTKITKEQDYMINDKLYSLIDLYNYKLQSQIDTIHNDINWLKCTNVLSYPQHLMISNKLDCSHYEINILCNCKFNYNILELECLENE